MPLPSRRSARSDKPAGWPTCAGSAGARGGRRLVTGFASDSFRTDRRGIAPKSLTDVIVTDIQEKELAELGFISLCQCYDSELAAFYSCRSLQKPATFDRPEATVNAQLGDAELHLVRIAVLAIPLKVMIRDKVGSSIEAVELESFLNNWLHHYVTSDDNASLEVKSRYPLREAGVEVRADPSRPGNYLATIHLRPHFQFDQLNASLKFDKVELARGSDAVMPDVIRTTQGIRSRSYQCVPKQSLGTRESSMTAKQLFEAGKLAEAVAAAGDEVKKRPLDESCRWFLCELLCFAGDLDRADKQLDLISTQDPKAVAGAALFRQLVRAELARQEFFREGRVPDPRGSRTGPRGAHLAASIELRLGNAPGAAPILAKARDETPPVTGRATEQRLKLPRPGRLMCPSRSAHQHRQILLGRSGDDRDYRVSASEEGQRPALAAGRYVGARRTEWVVYIPVSIPARLPAPTTSSDWDGRPIGALKGKGPSAERVGACCSSETRIGRSWKSPKSNSPTAAASTILLPRLCDASRA